METGCFSRILIVDDDPAVRTLVSRMLESAGYQVLQAEDGLAAWGILREHNKDLDLLITDIEMPRMNGNELTLRCFVEYPKLKILSVSAYTDSLSQNVHYFLAKPFTSRALLATVEKALGINRAREELQKPNEAHYWAKLVAAEARLEVASDEYRRLMEIRQDLGASSDGVLALRQAIKGRLDAIEAYIDALGEYTRFLIRSRSERSPC